MDGVRTIAAFGMYLDEEDEAAAWLTSLLSNRKRRRVPLPGYLARRALGVGSYGLVLAVERTSDGQLFAAKMARHSRAYDPKTRALLTREAGILSRLSHRNIVRLVEMVRPTDPTLIMEYAHGETLAQFIHESGAQEELRTIGLLCQLVHALRHMHDSRHRPPRPQARQYYSDLGWAS